MHSLPPALLQGPGTKSGAEIQTSYSGREGLSQGIKQIGSTYFK